MLLYCSFTLQKRIPRFARDLKSTFEISYNTNGDHFSYIPRNNQFDSLLELSEHNLNSYQNYSYREAKGALELIRRLRTLMLNTRLNPSCSFKVNQTESQYASYSFAQPALPLVIENALYQFHQKNESFVEYYKSMVESDLAKVYAVRIKQFGIIDELVEQLQCEINELSFPFFHEHRKRRKIQGLTHLRHRLQYLPFSAEKTIEEISIHNHELLSGNHSKVRLACEQIIAQEKEVSTFVALLTEDYLNNTLIKLQIEFSPPGVNNHSCLNQI